MKAFWWFKENSIAGMARPGFNSLHWFDLSFRAAALMGWIGQHSSGRVPLTGFRHHLETYVPKIFKFYRMDAAEGALALAELNDSAGLVLVLQEINERMAIFEGFEVADDHLHFALNTAALRREVDFLRAQGIERVISLTEQHHSREFLESHFELHHIAIQDLGAPRTGQAHALAEIVRAARERDEKIAVHCLAGIGRTSTMLMAAHLILGEDLASLQALLQRRNPTFIFTGEQADFIRELDRSLALA